MHILWLSEMRLVHLSQEISPVRSSLVTATLVLAFFEDAIYDDGQHFVKSGVWLCANRGWSDRFIRRSHTLAGELKFSFYSANRFFLGVISSTNLPFLALADQGYR